MNYKNIAIEQLKDFPGILEKVEKAELTKFNKDSEIDFQLNSLQKRVYPFLFNYTDKIISMTFKIMEVKYLPSSNVNGQICLYDLAEQLPMSIIVYQKGLTQKPLIFYCIRLFLEDHNSHYLFVK